MTTESRDLLARFAAWTFPGFTPHLFGFYLQAIVTGLFLILIITLSTVFARALVVWMFSSFWPFLYIVIASVVFFFGGEVYFHILRRRRAQTEDFRTQQHLRALSLIVNFSAIGFALIFTAVFFWRMMTCVTTYYISDRDMEPALSRGDFIVAEAGRAASDYEVGELVVFRHPQSRKLLIKRLVAKPGDSVSFQNGWFINGTRFRREYPEVAANPDLPDFENLRARADCYLVLGDNRQYSRLDSLTFGCLSARNFVARPRFIFFSSELNRIGNEFRAETAVR